MEEENGLIPYIFELSSWKDDYQTVESWLAEQLRKEGIRNKKIVQKWIAEGRLIPLLDGLDELGLKRQIKCMALLNEFASAYPQLVVCCRAEEYAEAHVALDALNGAVSIKPLSEQQIETYFSDLGRSDIWNALQTEPNLRRLLEAQDSDNTALLKIPLFLQILTVAYQENICIRNKSDLFDAYISFQLNPNNRATARRQLNQEWAYQDIDDEPTADTARHYLSWLATYLKRNYTTEFLIEHIQPDCLLSFKQRLQYNGILIAILCFPLIITQTLSGNRSLFLAILWWIKIALVALFFGLVCDYLRLILKSKADNNIAPRRPLRRITRGLRTGAFPGIFLGFFLWLALAFFNYLVPGITLGFKDYLSSFILFILLGLIGGISIGLILSTCIEIIYSYYRQIVNYLTGKNYYGRFFEAVDFTLLYKLRREIPRRFLKGISRSFLFSSLAGIGLVFFVFVIVPNINPEVLGHGNNVLDNPEFNPNAIEMGTLIFITGLLFGIIFSIIAGLISTLGIVFKDFESRDTPNKGIFSSARSYAFFSFIIYFGLTVPAYLQGEIADGSEQIPLNELLLYLFFAIQWAMLLGLPMGGSAVLQHIAVRSVLYNSGHIPQNYAQFLKYSTERRLVQQIGGRFRFIHRELLEHFSTFENA
ncbi:MAG: hypothetical protein AAF329_07205 [Cyanobacteria bacterium P01_A01_bin.17]